MEAIFHCGEPNRPLLHGWAGDDGGGGGDGAGRGEADAMWFLPHTAHYDGERASNNTLDRTCALLKHIRACVRACVYIQIYYVANGRMGRGGPAGRAAALTRSRSHINYCTREMRVCEKF